MKRWLGILIMATAVLHTVVGLLLAAQPLLDVVQSGFFNAVDPHYDRMASVWFLLFGALLFLLGLFVQWSLNETGRLPVSVGWGFLMTCTIGVILMPISGIWLGVIEAVIMLRIAYKKPENAGRMTAV